jgi:Transposase IS66 family
VPIALSTMADAVGSVCAALDPLLRLVEAHVLAAERLHGDDSVLQRHAERMIVMV